MEKRAWPVLAGRWGGATVFAGRFVGALVVLWGASMSPAYGWLVGWLTVANAAVCGGVLGLVGVPVEVQQGTVLSPAFALTVIPGCSGLEIWFFLVAAMWAVPASAGARLVGMAAALLAVLGLNVVRIVSLFLVGLHRPEAFDAVHLGLWPAVLNFGALAILGTWLAWTRVPTGKPV